MREIRPSELAAAIAGGRAVYLLDVRQQWEHEVAALPGSVLVPLDKMLVRADEIAPPAGALVVAYCHHGIRSRSAAMLLETRLGYQDVASLAGGIDAWAMEVDPTVPRY